MKAVRQESRAEGSEEEIEKCDFFFNQNISNNITNGIMSKMTINH